MSFGVSLVVFIVAICIVVLARPRYKVDLPTGEALFYTKRGAEKFIKTYNEFLIKNIELLKDIEELKKDLEKEKV